MKKKEVTKEDFDSIVDIFRTLEQWDIEAQASAQPFIETDSRDVYEHSGHELH